MGATPPEAVDLFDADWYATQGTGSRLGHPATLEHYLKTGWRQGYSPNALFNSAWYLETNPDVRHQKLEPLSHYAEYGWREGRNPHPLFDVAYYFRESPDLNVHKFEPLAHFMQRGWLLGLKPHPLFHTEMYVLDNQASMPAGMDPLTHFVTAGWLDGNDPNSLFETLWYRATYPEVKSFGLDPLSHYILKGAALGYDPGPEFSTQGFVKRYPEAGSQQQALSMYFTDGQKNGLQPVPSTLVGQVMSDSIPTTIVGTIPPSQRSLAIIASHDRRGSIGIATQHLANAFRARGFAVALAYDHDVTNAETVIAAGVADAVITADHEGYDFYSWRMSLESLDLQDTYDEIIIFNDSVIGPFGDFDRMLAAWRALPFDVTGLIESPDPYRHLQSWGVRFSGAAATPSALLRVYGKTRPVMKKGQLIELLEIPLGDNFHNLGYSTGSLFSATSTSVRIRNPTIFGWRSLLAGGMPFVKRDIVSANHSFVEHRPADVIGAVTALHPASSTYSAAEIVADSLAQLGELT